MDSAALDCPLVEELTALLAVLQSAMQSLQRLDFQHRDGQVPQSAPWAGLSQQLSQLHKVGLKLAERWDNFEAEDDRKMDFMRSLACEVRNLVSIVLNTSGTLERYGQSLEAVRRQGMLARMQQAIQGLTCLLEDAAMLQGMSGLREEVRLTHVDVELLCERIMREKKAVLPDRRIRFSRKGKSRLEQIDEACLRQTLYKVLDNAIAYSPSNSVVQLKVIWTEAMLTIQIQDMGIGIPEAALAEVCKPFYRAENARAVSGMGLGLAIAFQAMAQQRGLLEVMSQVGKGTTVLLHFASDRNRPEVSGGQAQVEQLHPVVGN